MNLFDVIGLLPRRALRVVAVLALSGVLVFPGQTGAFIAGQYRGFQAQITQTLERIANNAFGHESHAPIRPGARVK